MGQDDTPDVNRTEKNNKKQKQKNKNKKAKNRVFPLGFEIFPFIYRCIVYRFSGKPPITPYSAWTSRQMESTRSSIISFETKELDLGQHMSVLLIPVRTYFHDNVQKVFLYYF